MQKHSGSPPKKTEATALVTEAVTNHPVVIFSKTYCPFCHSAKDDIAAASKSVANMPSPKIFELDNMGPLGQAVQASLAETTGRRTVPNVFIAGNPVGGGSEIAAFASRGVLKQMLAKARDEQAPAQVDRTPAPASAPAPVAIADDTEVPVASADDAEVPVPSFVDAEIAQNPVVIFSKTYCPFCHRAKDAIAAASAEIPNAATTAVHELDHMGSRGAAIQDHLLGVTGQRTVPNIFIGSTHVGGCEEVLTLERNGELKPLIGKAQMQVPTETAVSLPVASEEKTIILGAGCFWGVQLALQRVPGVLHTEVAYSNGASDNITYDDVCSGTTQAAEVVSVRYDENVVSLPQLLDVWQNRHDPTSLNKQGNDVGTQYRSAIFFSDDAQLEQISVWKQSAETALGIALVTDIDPVKNYRKAEDYHQQYLEKKGQSIEKGSTEAIRCYG